jgi:hypothetical protein
MPSSGTKRDPSAAAPSRSTARDSSDGSIRSALP